MSRITFIIIISFAICSSCNNSPAKAPKSTAEPSEKRETMASNQTEEIKKKSILFFGDSLTAGLGLEEEESYPSLIQDRIDSMNLMYEVINAGLSGETSSGGLGRIEWVLNRPIDIFVLELGANDMLRGLSLEETEKNLRGILDVVKEKNPEANLIVAGMEAPPNMGQDYMRSFRKIFADVANDYNAGLIPFLLDGLQGKEGMDIGDGKHPNAEGQKVVRENVWNILNQYL